MNRVLNGMTVTLGLMLVLTTVISAQSGMMSQRPMGQSEAAEESSPGGMMGQGGMGTMGPQMMRGMMGGGMKGMPEGMRMLRPSQLVRMLKAQLGLSDEQVKQLTQISLPDDESPHQAARRHTHCGVGVRGAARGRSGRYGAGRGQVEGHRRAAHHATAQSDQGP